MTANVLGISVEADVIKVIPGLGGDMALLDSSETAEL